MREERSGLPACIQLLSIGAEYVHPPLGDHSLFECALPIALHCNFPEPERNIGLCESYAGYTSFVK